MRFRKYVAKVEVSPEEIAKAFNDVADQSSVDGARADNYIYQKGGSTEMK